MEEKIKTMESRTNILKNFLKEKDNEFSKQKVEIESMEKLRTEFFSQEKKIQELARQREGYKNDCE